MNYVIVKTNKGAEFVINLDRVIYFTRQKNQDVVVTFDNNKTLTLIPAEYPYLFAIIQPKSGPH